MFPSGWPAKDGLSGLVLLHVTLDLLEANLGLFSWFRKVSKGEGTSIPRSGCFHQVFLAKASSSLALEPIFPTEPLITSVWDFWSCCSWKEAVIKMSFKVCKYLYEGNGWIINVTEGRLKNLSEGCCKVQDEVSKCYTSTLWDRIEQRQ